MNELERRVAALLVAQSALSLKNYNSCHNQNMESEVIISKVLKGLMEKSGHTYKRLSELSGVSQSTLKDWGSGTEPRSFKSVKRVANVYGVSSEYLVFGEVETTTVIESLPMAELFSGWCHIQISIPQKGNKKE